MQHRHCVEYKPYTTSKLYEQVMVMEVCSQVLVLFYKKYNFPLKTWIFYETMYTLCTIFLEDPLKVRKTNGFR